MFPERYFNNLWNIVVDKWAHCIDREANSPCWRWIGPIMTTGYGVVRCGQINMLAHRVSFLVHNPEWGGELSVLHICDNRWCVNPDHLFLGDHQDNALDMVAKGRNHKVNLAGETNPSATLTWDEVRSIRHRYSIGNISIRQLSRDLNHPFSTIYRIVREINWKE